MEKSEPKTLDEYDKQNTLQLRTHKIKPGRRRRFKVGDEVVPVLSIYADGDNLIAGKIIDKIKVNGIVMYIVKFTIRVITRNQTHPMGKDINVFTHNQLLPAAEALPIAYEKQLQSCRQLIEQYEREIATSKAGLAQEKKRRVRLEKLLKASGS